jgi:hypothetical protein
VALATKTEGFMAELQTPDFPILVAVEVAVAHKVAYMDITTAATAALEL